MFKGGGGGGGGKKEWIGVIYGEVKREMERWKGFIYESIEAI